MAVPTSDRVVQALRVLAPLVALAFTAVVVVGLAAGTFASEGQQLLELGWGRITLVDTYLAFALAIGWAWLRETPAVAAGTTVLVLVLGSIAIWALVGWAAWRSADRRQLVLGRLAGSGT